MDRRSFLKTSAAAALAIAAPTSARAELWCSPPDAFGRQVCEAGLNSYLATISARSQTTTNWCWAACIEMIFKYYGHPVPQARVVEEVWGSIVDMPAAPSQILAALNRPWRDRFGRRFHSVGTTYGANPATAAQDLAANRPLIIGTRRHAMLLTSLQYVRDPFGNASVTRAVVRDPWPSSLTIATQGKRVLTAQEWYGTMFLARIRVY